MSDVETPRRRRVAVVIGATDDETRDEAFRAALGLSLRGAHVHVALVDAQVALGAAAQRARSVLEMMGHTVQLHAAAPPADELARADVIEVWGGVAATAAAPAAAAATAAAAAGGTTHLVRPGRHAAIAAPGDRVLHLPPVLDRDHADRLLDQLLAGDRVAVW